MNTNEKAWDLWDTKEKCRLGSDKDPSGPLIFHDWDLARYAATVTTRQVGHLVRPVPIPDDDYINTGEIPTRMDGPTAIQQCEEGEGWKV